MAKVTSLNGLFLFDQQSKIQRYSILQKQQIPTSEELEPEPP